MPPRIYDQCYVYLLHLEHDDGEVEHYVGSTKPLEIHRRMRAHAMQYGANQVRSAIEDGARLRVAWVFAAPDRQTEYDLQRHPDLTSVCYICRGKRPNDVTLRCQAIIDRALSLPQSPYRPFSW